MKEGYLHVKPHIILELYISKEQKTLDLFERTINKSLVDILEKKKKKSC